MSKGHVLFMVTDFAPLPSVGRIRTQKMCKFLPDFGWRTSVLTLQPPPGAHTDPALMAEVSAETKVHRVPWPQPIEAPVRLASRLAHSWRPGDADARPAAVLKCREDEEASGGPRGGSWVGPVSAGVDWLKRGLIRRTMIPDEAVTAIPGMVQAAEDLIRREQVDVLISSVPGFSPWLAAVIVGRRTGVPVVVDYRDLWYRDVLRTWIGPVRRRVELGLERWALARTRAVVGASEGKTRLVRGLDPTGDGKPYATIYNGFDEDDLRGLEPKRLERDAGRLVLLYTGRLYGHRRIDPLVESIGRVVNGERVPGDRLRLRMLGGIAADQQRRIAEIVRRQGLERNVESSGYVTRREALAQQLGADAAVLIVDPGETSAGVLPGKITEYLGMGRFVLAVCPPGEARDFLRRYGHAAWASADEPDRLDAALVELFARWCKDADFARPHRAPDVVPSRRDNAARLAEVLDQVAEPRPVAIPATPEALPLVKSSTPPGEPVGLGQPLKGAMD